MIEATMQDLAAAIRELTATLANMQQGVAPVAEAVAEVAPKAKRGKGKASEPEAVEPEAEAVVPEAVVPKAVEPEAGGAKLPTRDDLKAACLAVVQSDRSKKADIKALLSSMNASLVSDLRDEQLAEFAAKLETI
jgi:hypothetical protein